MDKARKQFCPQGHDTFLTGRDKSGHCVLCDRERKRFKKSSDAIVGGVSAPKKPRFTRVEPIELTGQIVGGPALRLREECARRGGMSPDKMMEEIMYIVIRDNLFAAVLDP
jgi:hypothetical protein